MATGNEVANAVVLLDSDVFYKWCKAASAYEARLVVTEDPTSPDHTARVALAQAVVNNPDRFAGTFVSVISADPAICGVGSDITVIGQGPLLTSISQSWTPLAKLLFPPVA